MTDFTQLFKTHKGRMRLIDFTHEIYEKDDNIQHNKTPAEIVEKMISKTKVDGKSILVMFNLEFVEFLVKFHKVDPKNISFFADTKEEQEMAKLFYGVNSVYADFQQFKTKTFMTEIDNMHFDLVFSNPPYNSNVDLKILQEVMPIADELVIVHPSTWLIDLKDKSKLYRDFKKQIGGHLKSVELFNGNPIFNIGLFVPCVITHIDNKHNGATNVKFFDEEYKVGDMADITKFGKNFQYIVKPFMQMVKAYVAQNGNVWDKRVEVRTPVAGKHYCQLAGIRGNVNMTTDTNKIVKDDFYTMIMDNPESNKGIRKVFDPTPAATNMPTFEFVSDVELTNFIAYLQTDFARFCFAIYKNNQKLTAGEMVLIPWLDFTQSWDDTKLFAHFGVDEETQKYIREFLPDYHNIRK